VKVTTHLHLVPRSTRCGAIPPLPIRLHGVVLRAQIQLYLLELYIYYFCLRLGYWMEDCIELHKTCSILAIHLDGKRKYIRYIEVLLNEQ
jgi:hypothetical protein